MVESPVDSASVRNCHIQPSQFLISKYGKVAGSSRSIVVVVEILISAKTGEHLRFKTRLRYQLRLVKVKSVNSRGFLNSKFTIIFLRF